MASGQSRRRQRSRRTTDQGKGLDVYQYYFYTAEAAGHFAAAQEGLAATCHPQLCPFISCQAARKELLSIVTLEIEASETTVESETLSRRKAGEHWTIKEVFRLLKDITAALVHLSTEVICIQGLCCVDISGENVAFVEKTFQLKLWGRKEMMDFWRLDPVYMSPEIKGCYAQWLGGQRTIAEIDYGKASVYSLGLLAITMLSPELCDFFLPNDQLEDVIKNLSSSTLLQQILQEMLTPDPALRPSPSDLAEILAARLRPDPVQQIASIFRAMGAADYDTIRRELVRLWDVGVVGRVEYPCSACGNGIELGKGKKIIDVCEKHLFCSVGCLVNLASNYQLPSDNQCPVCIQSVQPKIPPRRRVIVKKPAAPSTRKSCLTCNQPFDVRVSDSWRQQYQGSDVRTEDYCSLSCLPFLDQQSEMEPLPELTPQLCSDLEFLQSLEGQNCYMRRLDWSLPLLDEQPPPNNPMAEVAIRGVEGDLSFAQTLLMSQNPLFQCHFCGQQIENLSTGRWTKCGQKHNFVCSCTCLRVSLGLTNRQTVTVDVVCRACGDCITAKDIEIALGIGRRKCTLCMKRYSSERMTCGHQVCEECFNGTGHCLGCELTMSRRHQGLWTS